MATQLTGATAVLVSESDTQNYFVGGTFTLGSGPFTDLSFEAEDDETDFAAIGSEFGESFGAGRQLGTLTDGSGGTFDSGLTTLEEVLTIQDPVTGDTILVGRVEIREDNGSPGGGATTQSFYIFSAPINPNVTYDVIDIDFTPGGDGPTYEYNDFADSGVICFAFGTLIQTPHGAVPVETIKVGDLVQTVDHGLQPVLWVGARHVTPSKMNADARFCPVRIGAGVLGNQAPLFVTQQHRLLVEETLIKAGHLVGRPKLDIRIARSRPALTYVHILLEKHCLLLANGCAAESLYLGPVTRQILPRRSLLMAGAVQHSTFVRPVAKRHNVWDHAKRLIA
ncbi:Hint domain-containing protein [Pseudooctadecabacter jejudonensis]|uniref:Hedgehog/Intein (Hint) domain-containing protein n=1 Tax=Pseudooctadecabacter jejudonensis TaxID=1391910 RepID=A0A1Y5S2Z0_9RHOB|nr:Hint domain-containing protein [Pseudooctadecabacter jejudonensis]SLN28854.1 hypothetical protein PSJ8397_01227 [Pseudooctadecabacter jejudonensis]